MVLGIIYADNFQLCISVSDLSLELEAHISTPYLNMYKSKLLISTPSQNLLFYHLLHGSQ